jgi:hypothetical protein
VSEASAIARALLSASLRSHSLGSTLIRRGLHPLPISKVSKWRIIAGKSNESPNCRNLLEGWQVEQKNRKPNRTNHALLERGGFRPSSTAFCHSQRAVLEKRNFLRNVDRLFRQSPITE